MQCVKPSTKASRGKEINLMTSGGNKNATSLWSMRDAKAGGKSYSDRVSEQHIGKTEAQLVRALWEAYVKSPTAAPDEALRRTEKGVNILFRGAGVRISLFLV